MGYTLPQSRDVCNNSSPWQPGGCAKIFTENIAFQEGCERNKKGHMTYLFWEAVWSTGEIGERDGWRSETVTKEVSENRDRGIKGAEMTDGSREDVDIKQNDNGRFKLKYLLPTDKQKSLF